MTSENRRRHARAAGPNEWFSAKLNAQRTDEIISKNLRNGDVLLVNKRCASFTDDPLRAVLCLASKYVWYQRYPARPPRPVR